MKYAVTNTTTSFPDWSFDEWNDQQGENVWQTMVWTAMGLVMLFISRVVNDLMTCVSAPPPDYPVDTDRQLWDRI